uniref:UDP-glucuronosyltransferase n=1 Tax=Panagrolaimus davidi TaxID=227884 RepID=A0A914PA20_9BILA
MNKGNRGIVLVSFGTAVYTPSFSIQNRKEMFKAFSEFPEYHFLMKISSGDNGTIELAKNVSNIEFLEWFPQSDLLHHSNIKAFISHGGFNSVLETARTGIPAIILPFFYDQFRNGKMLEFREMGKIISKKDFGKESLKNALKEVLYNPKYKKAAERMKNLIAKKPNQPDETFLKWINFLLEQENLPELIPVGAKMNIISYLSLDVFSVFILCFILFVCYSPSNYPTDKEWDARLTMERSTAIKCPWIGLHLAVDNVLIRAFRPPVVNKVVSELGTYGFVFGNSTKVLRVHSHGHISRSKAEDVNEGGVAVGAAAIDSVYLF